MLRRTLLDQWPLPDLLSDGIERPKGLILKAGLRSPDVSFIARGRVRLVAESPGLNPVRAIDLSQGSVFGLAAVLEGVPTSATAFALETCELKVISADRLLNLVATDVRVSRWCLTALAVETRRRDAVVAAFGGNAEARLQVHLAELLEEGRTELDDGCVRLSVVPTQEELAQVLGVTRGYVSELLARGEAQGWILRKNGRLVAPPSSPVLALADPTRVHGSHPSVRRRGAGVSLGERRGTDAR